MDPIVAGSLIKVGGSLLGGLFGKKPKTVSARENSRGAIMGQAEGARKAAAEFGFNPVTLLGASSGIGTTSIPGDNTMGAAIADAGLALAQGLVDKAAETSRIAELETANKELQKKLVDQTLRPTVGGIYSAGGPSIRAARPASVVAGDGQPPVPTAAASDEGTLPAVLPLKLWGRDFFPSTDSSDGDAWEGRYGDIGGAIVGVPMLAGDLYEHSARPAREFKQMRDELDRSVSDFREGWRRDDYYKTLPKYDPHEDRFKGGYRPPRPF